MNAKYTLPTSEEIDRRLRIVSELRNLCLSLGRARPVAPAPDAKLGGDEKRVPDALTRDATDSQALADARPEA